MASGHCRLPEGCPSQQCWRVTGPDIVLEAMTQHLMREADQGRYESAEATAQVYDSVSTLIGASAAEIALVESATRAWDMAFYSIPFVPGDRILTSTTEYASNYLAFLHIRATQEVEIAIIPDDPAGNIDPDILAQYIDERTRLIALTHVPTNGGVVSPAVEVGKIATESGVLYPLDAGQSIGQLPIDVDEISCDFLSATGRKYLLGPRGTGFLHARTATTAGLHPPFIDLHAATWAAANSYEPRDDARRFKNWEELCWSIEPWRSGGLRPGSRCRAHRDVCV